MKRFLWCSAVVVLVGMVLSGCTESSNSTSSSVQASRCQPASARQLAHITAGVKGEASSNSVRTGSAVKSKDYANAYFVAAKIYGPGIEEGVGPGVWFITGDPDSPGLIFSVNGYAEEFSDFGHADRTDAAATMGSDGAREAERCAQ